MGKTDIEFLRSEVKRCPYLVHASNILTRYDKHDKVDVLESVVPAYMAYCAANHETGFDLPTISKRVAALNAYYDVLHDLGLEGNKVYSTAEKLKAGNPYTFFGIVAETYDVSMDVNPAYSRIDQIYILRKTSRRGVKREIDPDVVFSMIKDVQAHLEKPWSNIEQKLKSTGMLI